MFRSFSHVGYYRILSRVPCILQWVLPYHSFKHNFIFLGTMVTKSITSKGPCYF